MKHILVLSCILILCSCGSNTNDKPDDDGPKPHTEDEGYDTTLWVGLFANWEYQPGIKHTGNYDTVTSLFKLCNSNDFFNVSRDLVHFISGDNCDELKNRVNMVLMKKDSVKSLGPVINLDVESPTPTIRINVGQEERVYNIKKTDVPRINRTKRLSPARSEVIINNNKIERNSQIPSN